MPTAVEMVLMLEEIPGQFADHKGAIDVVSFTFGESRGEGNKASLDNLVIVKQVDTSSPSLFLACAKGTHLRKGELLLVPAVRIRDTRGRSRGLYVQPHLVESVMMMGHENAGFPTEQVSL